MPIGVGKFVAWNPELEMTRFLLVCCREKTVELKGKRCYIVNTQVQGSRVPGSELKTEPVYFRINIQNNTQFASSRIGI